MGSPSHTAASRSSASSHARRASLIFAAGNAAVAGVASNCASNASRSARELQAPPWQHANDQQRGLVGASEPIDLACTLGGKLVGHHELDPQVDRLVPVAYDMHRLPLDRGSFMREAYIG
jgi:hypothetical protein